MNQGFQKCVKLEGRETRQRERYTCIRALSLRPEGELIKDLLLPTPPRTWCSQTGGRLKAWTTTIKVNHEFSVTLSTRLVMPAQPIAGECDKMHARQPHIPPIRKNRYELNIPDALFLLNLRRLGPACGVGSVEGCTSCSGGGVSS